MLTPQNKQNLDLIIDRMGTLKSVRWNEAADVVEIDFEFRFDSDEQPEATDDWPLEYQFRLSGTHRIFISPHKEKIPPELATASPSKELIHFLLRTFEDQGVYEWTIFPQPSSRFSGNWAFGWDYRTKDFSSDLEFACIFKERGDLFRNSSAVWVAGFWFNTLQIITNAKSDEALEIEAFISRYLPYAEKTQA